ncbi:MAG: putative metallo-hydrolase [Planctomycetes bacterium ADurb.Bin401]|nr:MAG: putative metallo-hydrolase [Planctomycetes bacterium ADurb.Bin401]
MQISKLVLGDYENNSYIVRKENLSNCLIIDTGLDSIPLVEYLKEKKLNPAALVLTHGHVDHIAGVENLRKNFNSIKVYIHKSDAPMLCEPSKNFSTVLGLKIQTSPADILLTNEGDTDFQGFNFNVIHTPGHTSGGICLYSEENKVLFTGDTLFAHSVGRTDFPGYDADERMRQLIKNIKEKLLVLPEDTNVYPGHGPATTIKQEKLHNPYLQ